MEGSKAGRNEGKNEEMEVGRKEGMKERMKTERDIGKIEIKNERRGGENGMKERDQIVGLRSLTVTLPGAEIDRKGSWMALPMEKRDRQQDLRGRRGGWARRRRPRRVD